VRNGDDEPQFARESVDDLTWLSFQVPGAIAKTVEVEARLLCGVGNMLFESVIAEVRGRGRQGRELAFELAHKDE